MSESEVIARTSVPASNQSLAGDLRRLGLSVGQVIIVHASLSALGWVNGGPVAVIQALMEVLTQDGTLVMPTHSSDLSDPANWQNPPVPENWLPVLYETMPAFDPLMTPTRGMGRIAETFRSCPGVTRSNHPIVSFAAWGRYATEITARHEIDFGMSNTSPLGALYDLNGQILLLGVGFNRCTCFHLAQYRQSDPVIRVEGSPIREEGNRVWKRYRDINTDIGLEDFPEIGLALEKEGCVQIGKIALADCRFFPVRSAVDFAEEWMRAKFTKLLL
jgi:aminoglycoside 3-N-acetyltransferase